MRGLRKYLPPFAPDISGASSVLYEMGGILVICDAGGCTGNVCGFDEPRWFLQRSCIFSAGLRDMDAIFGKDDKLVEKLTEAARQIEAAFVCLIGTPVPAVIGTDYQALKRMAEKKIKLPVLTIETSGIRQYDAGEEMAYIELFQTFATEKMETEKGRIGVIGATPLSVSSLQIKKKLQRALGEDKHIVCYGMGDGLDMVRQASKAEKNLVLSPSGIKAAEYLKESFGTPYEVGYPVAAEFFSHVMFPDEGKEWKVLIVHQQVLANEVRRFLREKLGEHIQVTVASFFMLNPELKEQGDLVLKEEADLIRLADEGDYNLVIADNMIKPVFAENISFIDIPHFACSGRLCEE